MKEINFNHESLNLSSVKIGKTDFAVKSGRKSYILSVHKYDCVSIIKDDNSGNYSAIVIPGNQRNIKIDRDFFDNIENIQIMQNMERKFEKMSIIEKRGKIVYKVGDAFSTIDGFVEIAKVMDANTAIVNHYVFIDCGIYDCKKETMTSTDAKNLKLKNVFTGKDEIISFYKNN